MASEIENPGWGVIVIEFLPIYLNLTGHGRKGSIPGNTEHPEHWLALHSGKLQMCKVCDNVMSPC